MQFPREEVSAFHARFTSRQTSERRFFRLTIMICLTQNRCKTVFPPYDNDLPDSEPL